MRLCGECLINHSFSWPARPEHYEGTPVGDSLLKIRAGLAKIRGHREFIKSPQVPPCDYYVPGQKFIVEFDESQHFSRARLVALGLYPRNLKFGFSLSRWQELCRQMDAKDATPVDRDERRAWYDTLRDLVPTLHGFKPTVRLYAEEIQWCSLDGATSRDVDIFYSVLRGKSPIEID